MREDRIELEEFLVIGIAVRTTNQNGQCQKDIGELWDRFMGQNLAANIPNKKSENIYSVYTDYESDFRGYYTVVLCCEVTSLSDIPAGFVGKKIAKSTYLRYQAAGQSPECVVRTWETIWSLEDKINRKYADDFEVYQDGGADIYISVK